VVWWGWEAFWECVGEPGAMLPARLDGAVVEVVGLEDRSEGGR
jgi:hypothetical protein